MKGVLIVLAGALTGLGWAVAAGFVMYGAKFATMPARNFNWEFIGAGSTILGMVLAAILVIWLES